MGERHPLWHERRRWVVMVAHPGTDVQRQDDLPDWGGEPMSRECLDSMTLQDIPLHIEHSRGERHVAGRVVRDIQTPHDADGRRVVVADCVIDQPGGGVASRMLDEGLLREGSIRHEFAWKENPDGSRVGPRSITNTEFSLCERGRRQGCVLLGVFKREPSAQEVHELIERTRPVRRRAAVAASRRAAVGQGRMRMALAVLGSGLRKNGF